MRIDTSYDKVLTGPTLAVLALIIVAGIAGGCAYAPVTHNVTVREGGSVRVLVDAHKDARQVRLTAPASAADAQRELSGLKYREARH